MVWFYSRINTYKLDMYLLFNIKFAQLWSIYVRNNYNDAKISVSYIVFVSCFTRSHDKQSVE